jgi:hypothetical protein
MECILTLGVLIGFNGVIWKLQAWALAVYGALRSAFVLRAVYVQNYVSTIPVSLCRWAMLPSETN